MGTKNRLQVEEFDRTVARRASLESQLERRQEDLLVVVCELAQTEVELQRINTAIGAAGSDTTSLETDESVKSTNCR